MPAMSSESLRYSAQPWQIARAGVPGRTRPLCRYLDWPKYKGVGDVNAASSFTCAAGKR
jgi:hypothetical protein